MGEREPFREPLRLPEFGRVIYIDHEAGSERYVCLGRLRPDEISAAKIINEHTPEERLGHPGGEPYFYPDKQISRMLPTAETWSRDRILSAYARTLGLEDPNSEALDALWHRLGLQADDDSS